MEDPAVLGLEQTSIRRLTCVNILFYSTVCPFKWSRSHFHCLYCTESFANFSQLRQHTTEQHSSVPKATIRKQITSHKKFTAIKANVTDLECKICNNKVLDFKALKNHLLTIHDVKCLDVVDDGIIPYKITDIDFACAICETEFNDFKNLTTHMNTHFRNCICDLCGSGFSDSGRLKRHMVSHETGSYSCDRCGKVFQNVAAKNAHVSVVHLNKKLNKCPHCAATFKNYGAKKRHLISEHGLKVAMFNCDLCPATFLLSGKLLTHKRQVHMRIKRYPCSVCEWKFYTSSSLKVHMKCHGVVDETYDCEVCKKKFARKKSLTEHMRIHNNDRRFSCDVCGKTFIQKCSLKSHKCREREKKRSNSTE